MPPEQWPVASGWHALVAQFWASATGGSLKAYLAERVATGATVFPPEPLRALRLTDRLDVRVVILGQDPYHGIGQAEGLAFSVGPGVRVPPSLANIRREVARDCGVAVPVDGSLLAWARRGTLLLNTVLTVEEGCPASHANKGWEALTDEIVRALACEGRPRVFLLWGAHAQEKRGLIEGARTQISPAAEPAAHLILTCNHPSPLAARRPPQPFIGCGHFSAARDWLEARGVSWSWEF